MADPFPLQSVYAGMQRDSPRDQLPGGALWDCRDFVPIRISAALQKRGGWTYGSPALDDTSYVQALCRTPDYGAGAFNLAITDDGEVYTFTDNTFDDIDTAFAVLQNPVVHRSDSDTWLVIITADDGATTPKSWDGTTFGDLGGTPPKAIYAAVWNDYTILGNGQVDSTSYPGRIWFSNLGNAAGTWDTTSSWWDFQLPVVGLAGVRNGILVFHARSTSRLRGTHPATTSPLAVSDFVQDDPFPGDASVGCIDARTICHYNDWVIWADFTGIYRSDGVSIENLTSKGGMSRYWVDLIAANYGSGYVIAAGVFRDRYIISITDDSQQPVDCLVYDMLENIWFRFGNMPGLSFMHIPGQGADKTYMGLGSEGRVASLETCFTAQTSSDADATPILPSAETAIFRGFMRVHRRYLPSMAIQSWRWVFLTYELVNGGADPELTLSYCKDATDPNNVSWTTVSDALPSSPLASRVRRDLSFRSRSLAFKWEQTAASTDTMIRALEAVYEPIETSRLEQPVPPGVSDAPVLNTAVAGNHQVTLGWTAPLSDGGSPVTSYNVYRGTSSGSETLLHTVGVVGTYVDLTAGNGTTYYYKVSALNAAGESPLSNELSATPVAPAKVMKSDASSADAWAEIDLVTPQPDLWVTFLMRFSPAALTFWAANSTDFIVLQPVDHSTTADEIYISAGPSWTETWGGAGGTPVADTWQTVELHHVNGGAAVLYVDGVAVVSGTDDGMSGDVRYVKAGQIFASNDPSAVVYINDFKVGTTRGASDLFSDDFESGNLGSWTDTSGAVSVVDDPF